MQLYNSSQFSSFFPFLLSGSLLRGGRAGYGWRGIEEGGKGGLIISELWQEYLAKPAKVVLLFFSSSFFFVFIVQQKGQTREELTWEKRKKK